MKNVLNNCFKEVQELLVGNHSLSVMGMPGGGISIFLKELQKSDQGKSIYIDIFGLPELSSRALFAQLAKELGIKNYKELDKTVFNCAQQLKKLSLQAKFTLYFAGFDQLKPILNAEFLQALNSLARSSDNVRLVFGLCYSLKKLIPDKLFDSGLRLFGNVYYLKPYNSVELKYFLKIYGPFGQQSAKSVDESIVLSGGHFQLFKLLLETNSTVKDVADESMRLLFKNLYSQLLGPQRATLRKISQKTGQGEPDEYLLGIGEIKKVDNHYELFSPLFADYIASINTKRLPVKERRLFLLLKKNLDRTVPKQQIVDVVWQGEIASEWALNALVYRLRKHSAFISQGYEIISHKKLGYSLTKNS